MATEGLVDIDPFFKSKFKFPWDFMGLTLPCAGSVHGYIASIVAPYYPDPARSILAQRPTLSELRRFGKLQDGDIFNQIVTFADKVADNRMSVAANVLEFLSAHGGFRQAFQSKIDEAYRKGTISIPKDCEPGAKKWQRHTNESW